MKKDCSCIKPIRGWNKIAGVILLLKMAIYYLFWPNWVEGRLWLVFSRRKDDQYHRGFHTKGPKFCNKCRSEILKPKSETGSS